MKARMGSMGGRDDSKSNDRSSQSIMRQGQGTASRLSVMQASAEVKGVQGFDSPPVSPMRGGFKRQAESKHPLGDADGFPLAPIDDAVNIMRETAGLTRGNSELPRELGDPSDADLADYFPNEEHTKGGNPFMGSSSFDYRHARSPRGAAEGDDEATTPAPTRMRAKGDVGQTNTPMRETPEQFAGGFVHGGAHRPTSQRDLRVDEDYADQRGPDEWAGLRASTHAHAASSVTKPLRSNSIDPRDVFHPVPESTRKSPKGDRYVSGATTNTAMDAATQLKPFSLMTGDAVDRPSWATQVRDNDNLDARDAAALGLESRTPYLFNPRGDFMFRWDVFVGVCLLYTAVWTPYEIAFHQDWDSDDSVGVNWSDVLSDPLFWVNRVVDAAFIADIAVTFFLPYYTPDNKLVADHRKIVWTYLYGWFPIDFFAVVPYDLIAYAVETEEAARLKFLRLVRLLRLAKLLRIVRVGRVFRRFEANREINYAALSLHKFSLGILFLAHWMACLFYLVAMSEDRRVNWTTEYFNVYEKNVEPDGTIRPVDKGSLYIASVYWAVATLSTLGYGDVVPETNAERIYSVAATFMGGAVYAYLLGSVCSVITNVDESSNVFYRQMDELNRFMREKGLTQDLRVKLRDYFRFRRNSRAMVEWSNVMHLMSDSLRLDVAEEVFGRWVHSMPIFRDCPKRLPGLLSAHLSSLVLSPHEDLMANPMKRDCLFIVEKGLVAHRGVIQETGALLGVERIYKTTAVGLANACAPAITLSHCVVLCLERDSLLQVVNEFPRVARNMRRMVVRIIFREAIIHYARAVRSSVSTKGGVTAMNRLLGVHGAGLASLAESHRLKLLRRENPEYFKRLWRGALVAQKLFRGRRTRQLVRTITLKQQTSTPGARDLVDLLVNINMHRHISSLTALKIERRHLTVMSALELCQVTRMPFRDAADVILAARTGRTFLTPRNSMTAGGEFHESDIGFYPGRVAESVESRLATLERKLDSIKGGVAVDSDDAPTPPPPPVEKRKMFAFTPPPPSPLPHRPWASEVPPTPGAGGSGPAADPAEERRLEDISLMPSSASVFAARALRGEKQDVGMLVIEAAAKFKEGGARYRARSAQNTPHK